MKQSTAGVRVSERCGVNEYECETSPSSQSDGQRKIIKDDTSQQNFYFSQPAAAAAK